MADGLCPLFRTSGRAGRLAASGGWLRYVGGAALLVLGAVAFPPPGQLVKSVSAWLVVAVSGICFTGAYKLLAPPGAPALDPAAKRVEATEQPAVREELSSRTS